MKKKRKIFVAIEISYKFNIESSIESFITKLQRKPRSRQKTDNFQFISNPLIQSRVPFSTLVRNVYKIYTDILPATPKRV